MNDVYLAFGSNLGDRERNIGAALSAMSEFATVGAISSLYETDPVPEGQPAYLNAACRISTDLSPKELLRRVKDVERTLGRRGGARWSPRPIDIDLLIYNRLEIEEDGLRLPHEGLAERAFVLVPLADIAADVQPPSSKKTVRELADGQDLLGVRLHAEAGWEKSWLR